MTEEKDEYMKICCDCPHKTTCAPVDYKDKDIEDALEAQMD